MNPRSGVLETFLDQISNLPTSLVRNMSLMHELDSKSNKIIKDLDATNRTFFQSLKKVNYFFFFFIHFFY
jgi:hypothetical protein